MIPSGYAAPASGGFFSRAQNTVITDTTMIDNSKAFHFYGGQNIHEILHKHSIEGTEMNSLARYPPPRCHPGTRESVTKAIFEWMRNLSRKWNVLWVFGLAGVGKTAVAQTVAETAKGEQMLGAAFFISRPRGQNDPGAFFISIAYQLSLRDEKYRRHVEEQVMADPGLLKKDMETQFQKLIVEPLSHSNNEQKLLIIIDGLDECQGTDAQRSIINLITSSAQRLPIIWMICSRPEYQIKSAFNADRVNKLCWRKEITVDDSETRRDIETFLWARFKGIAEKYGIRDWPAAEDLEKLINAASGYFVYAETVSRYVEDPGVDDPETQLEGVIQFIDSPAQSSTLNPFHYLDQLYMEILKDVQPQQRAHALQLIGISALYPSLPALQLANLLGLRRNRFEAALRRLYSVVEVTSDKPCQNPLRIIHASFIDFLTDPKRSGQFALNLDQLHADFAKACFGVISQTALRYAKNLVWKPEPNETPAFTVADHILTYCAKSAWEACYKHGDALDADLLKIVVQYRYSFLCFLRDKIPGETFHKWSEWLVRQIRLHNLENIVQPAEWDDDCLRDTFGSRIPNGVENNDVYAFTLGAPSKRVMVIIIDSSHVYFCEI
ncbi:hypothetical protein AGABI2DRAFT_177512 [Agaricus bisporus var. bisporus H97]|uniref:hypothetical protein n=1 Tax=Agaricus bisporus var. bisporus (strain H97 / ATCC MYA-4626 / FGSC 10389) TaxID=936046 RepID=UPI00029F7A3F|nr:hypothetical protein AGABI2DRAFT_177512 [Agaricus bisporus var. bisporus H97]EKV49579.1 hypothetical protein AGABI2DRAFT_177512 [Agaricus bisporus var. bisporus H97]